MDLVRLCRRAENHCKSVQPSKCSGRLVPQLRYVVLKGPRSQQTTAAEERSLNMAAEERRILAALSGSRMAEAEALISAASPAVLNAADEDFNTPLHHAAETGACGGRWLLDETALVAGMAEEIYLQ
jgi:hypothetical protein